MCHLQLHIYVIRVGKKVLCHSYVYVFIVLTKGETFQSRVGKRL